MKIYRHFPFRHSVGVMPVSLLKKRHNYGLSGNFSCSEAHSVVMSVFLRRTPYLSYSPYQYPYNRCGLSSHIFIPIKYIAPVVSSLIRYRNGRTAWKSTGVEGVGEVTKISPMLTELASLPSSLTMILLF